MGVRDSVPRILLGLIRENESFDGRSRWKIPQNNM